MTIEEKAKVYDEALEKARKLYEQGTITESLSYVFPELAESEDERIRKTLVGLITWASSYSASGITTDEAKEMIAWLEKQGQTYTKRDIDDAYLEGMAFAKNELEKQSEQKPVTIDVDKMVMEYSHTLDGDFGLPVKCQLRSYRQGVIDTLNLSSNIEKQGEQKISWSEEDEQIILSIEQVMNCASLLNIVPEKIGKIKSWLKSLKQRIGG